MKKTYIDGLSLISILIAGAAFAGTEVHTLMPGETAKLSDLPQGTTQVSCSLPIRCKCELEGDNSQSTTIQLNQYEPTTGKKLKQITTFHLKKGSQKAWNDCNQSIRRRKECNSLF